MKLPKIIKLTQAPKWLRITIPLVLVVGWLVASAVGGPYFGKISEVSTTDLTSFLPKSSEATKVSEQLSLFRDSKSIPSIIIFDKNNQVLSDVDKTALGAVPGVLEKVDGVEGSVSPPIISEDGEAAYVVLPLASDGDFKTIFPAVREKLDGLKLGIDYKMGGPASFARDLQKAFSGIDVNLLLVSVAVVFLILLVVYRSIILPIIVLVSALGALSVAIFVVWNFANAGLLQLNGQVQGILFILVIGAATDYSLLYIARYREELANYKTGWQATHVALKASLEPILAAGGTVILGLMCLLLSDLASNKALGPVGGIGVALAMLSSLTFLPAMLLPLSRWAFWPRTPKFIVDESVQAKKQHPFWSKIGDFVERRTRFAWAFPLALLLVACIGFFQLRADGVAQSDLILGNSEARDAQAILDEHFPGGSGTPTFIISGEKSLAQLVTTLENDPAVASVYVTANNSPSGSMPLGKAELELKQSIRNEVDAERNTQLAALRIQLEQQMSGLPVALIDSAYQSASSNIPSVETIVAQAYPFKDSTPKSVDAKVLLQATLKDAADSSEARSAIVRLRDSVRLVDSGAIIGGTTAVQYDTNQASIRDRYVLIPTILVVITIVLVMLLRSIVAPLILLFTTVVSFGATLGISAILFNDILKFPGADPSVILFGFVFLVALGIDYNIFLMSRVREETIKLGVRKGTIRGLVVTGGVITSAGIVLAATFAALGVIPILFLFQLAFIVAFGVLLDTVIVRSLLVPALTLEIGSPIWWPSKLARTSKERTKQK